MFLNATMGGSQDLMSASLTKFRNLIEALDAAPADRPFITFWIDDDERETVTFADFRDRSRFDGGILREHGVSPGDRVVIVMPPGIRSMTTFVGAMMVGAVPAFLAYPNFKVEASKYRAGLAGVSANLQAKVVVIDDEFPDDLLGHVSLEKNTQLIRGSAIGRTMNEAASGDFVASAENVALIQHSAGTTGLQKGVALTHAAVLRQLDHLAQALKIDPRTDSIYSWLPLYHDMGLIACFMLPLVCHLPIVMQSPIDWVMHPETMLQIISEYKCTLAWMPNFAFQFVPRRSPKHHWAHCDLSSARAIINCSETVRSTSMLEFERAFSSIGLRPGVLQSSYAMAENVFAVTQSEVNGAAGPTRLWADGARFRNKQVIKPVTEGTPGAILFASSGKVLPGTEVRIVSNSGSAMEPGSVGEIVIRGDSLFTGYFNRPDLTAQAIVEGWFLTGDLGFVYEGELYVVGRKKDLLIVGGENVYAQDIEELVAGHPSIHDGRAVATGIYNPELGTEDMIVVAEVEREELLANGEEIEREIRNLIIGGSGVAARTIFLKPPKWIVKSTAGKIARSATREKLIKEHLELDVEE